MVDERTKERFRVKSDQIAGPFLILPRSQLAAVREILDRNAISYWVATLIRKCATSDDGQTLVAGDASGVVHLLKLER